MKITSPTQLTKLRTDLAAQDKKLGKKVMICCGPGCLANGAAKLVQEFRSFDFASPWEGVEYLLPGDEKAEN